MLIDIIVNVFGNIKYKTSKFIHKITLNVHKPKIFFWGFYFLSQTLLPHQTKFYLRGTYQTHQAVPPPEHKQAHDLSE